MFIKKIFNAELQKETDHKLTAAPNGEVVATCLETGRVLKFPAGVTAKQFEKLLKAHKETNEGQVTQDSIDKTLVELADKEVDENEPGLQPAPESESAPTEG